MLSVIIITKNEEGNIRRCLESVKWADEVIVLDSGSLDKTVAIAHEYTDKVYLTDWRGFGIQKQRALSFASGDWVLNLDADEAVDEKLKKEIQHAITSGAADAYRIPIRMYFYGKPLRYSSSPTRHVRLFRKKGARYSDDIVHEKIMLPGGSKVSQLKNPLIHHSFRDLTHALYKINLYSSYTAKIRIQRGEKTNVVKIGFSTGWMFFRCFILQRGFLDGFNGLIFAGLNTLGTLFRGLKQLYPDRQLKDLPEVKKIEGERDKKLSLPDANKPGGKKLNEDGAK
ncbi:lipopolysaccharide biosynthesis glycosyltransferase [Legionella adelaidensis]|nr:glycosyltransferase family 2 protein [Legionella adelaidensis]KTC66007.1 lipopolysaccharide biosynthesis glycosyltransferase [Legionella adelaidensis]